MKIMYFNCRGLAGPLKISSLKRMVFLECLDIILLQETLGIGEVVKARLEGWFSRWNFETLDVRGSSGGLAIGWNDRNVKVLNLWGSELNIGIYCSDLVLGEFFTVCNVYGPYLNRIPFRDSLLNNPLLRGDLVILGGDLNFSLGQAESCGPHSRADSLTGFFL